MISGLAEQNGLKIFETTRQITHFPYILFGAGTP
jgi:hypothetical protein